MFSVLLLSLKTTIRTYDLSFQVFDVKMKIETVQGSDVYPAAQQILIYQGKVLKDDTTLEENKVAENSFVVIMLTKVTFFFLSVFLQNCFCLNSMIFTCTFL